MRNYKKKTDRGSKSLDSYTKAVKLVLEHNKSIRSVAKELDLSHVTLFNIIKKKKQGLDVKVGYGQPRRVFNSQQEKKLVEYLSKCSKIYFGLLPKEVKKLAYECAIKFNVKTIPSSWYKHQSAGPDWLASFLKRNSELSICKPEAACSSRATLFNQSQFGSLFSNLDETESKYDLPLPFIWNLDEIEVTAVQNPKTIITEGSAKQVEDIPTSSNCQFYEPIDQPTQSSPSIDSSIQTLEITKKDPLDVDGLTNHECFSLETVNSSLTASAKKMNTYKRRTRNLRRPKK